MGTASAPRERGRRGGLGLPGDVRDARTLTDLFRNVLERAFGLPLHRSKFVARSFECQDQFGELDLQSERVAVLRRLDQKHHKKVTMVVPVLITSCQVSL